jgi:NADPH:quinone reductase-like Zn-dependent oxidoreductase/pimeloyl-ACP methyl ester carboxylesterase
MGTLTRRVALGAMKPMIHKGYADTPSGQVHFRRVNGPGAPIILFHRTPVDSASFEAVLNILAGERAAVALDTPGFGQSFRPHGLPDAPAYARWFLAAIDALEIDTFHLCAHHTGTHFATEIAVLAPARTQSLLLSGVLYAGAKERAEMKRQIGLSPPVDEAGEYLASTWAIMKSLFPHFDSDLVHTETLGALGSPEGRNQAFAAILGQDFAGVLKRVACPIWIAQASDDPLTPMLDRVRAAHPKIGVNILDAAGMALPERQPSQFAANALGFAATVEKHPSPPTKSRPMTNRTFQLFKAAQGFDLKQTETEVPTPGPGEVLVKVRAVSLNRRDVMILKGQGYPTGDADGFVPMSDAAGEVVALGEGVTGLAVGDRVCSTFFQNWADGRISIPALMSALGAGGRGVLADHIVLSASGVAPAPIGWSFEEAATLPCAAVTAWSSLMTHGGLQSGDWALVQGTGGVALFGLQIAVAAGAKVAIISSSDEKLARAKAMGATALINYVKTPEWDVAVREATGGVNQVLELGGAGTLQKSLASLALGGHAALVGGLAGFGGEISAAGMVIGVQRISAVSVGSRADQMAVTDFLVKHGVKPVIDKVFDLGAIHEAYDRADAGAFGKVVVRLD